MQCLPAKSDLNMHWLPVSQVCILGCEYHTTYPDSLGSTSNTVLPFSQYLPTALELHIDKAIGQRGLVDGILGANVQLNTAKKNAIDTSSRRRLMQAGTSSSGSVATVGLNQLMPMLRDSPIGAWVLERIDIQESFIYWSDATRVVPALRANGSFSLNRYPFNQIGITGMLDVSVEAFPWYGVQTFLEIASPVNQVTLFAEYHARAALVPGVVELDNVWVQVIHAMLPVSTSPPRTTITVGGTLDFTIPSQTDALTLEADATFVIGRPGVLLHGRLGNYENAFGISGLTLESLDVRTTIGQGDLESELTAMWDLPGRETLQMSGIKSSNFIGVGVAIQNVTLGDMTGVFQRMFGGQPSNIAQARHVSVT